MQKKWFYGLGIPINVSKTVKFLFVCITFLSFGVHTVYAQDNRVTLKVKDVSLEQVLLELKKQTSARFFYSMDKIQNIRNISVDVKGKELGEFLKMILEGTNLSFTYVDNVVVLKDKQKEPVKPAKETIPMEVKGLVKDTKGNTIPGVTLIVKGTNIGCVTDIDGTFKLSLPKQDNITLVFSFVGMKTIEVVYKGQTSLNVVMEEDVKEMEEVVVTGIFERKAESFTGAATVIKKDELLRAGNQNLLQNLKNLDPAFKIVENLDYGSDPNRMPEIQMRGEQGIPDIKGTYNGNPNQPLFILDGFEADINTVFDLDMNRVETVVLLKDAAAKAIYGSRAANGVVVIETHQPEAGRLRISYKGDLNITAPDLNGYNLCDAREKYEIMKRFDPWESNDPTYKLSHEKYLAELLRQVERGVDTYWLSKPLRVGVGHKHSLYLEGGDERIRYSMDLMYNDVTGVMKGSDRKTFTGGFSLAYRYKNLSFRNQLSVSLNRADDSPYGAFSEYVMMNPYWSPYDEDGNEKQIAGTHGGGGIKKKSWGNPLYNATLNTNNFSKYTELINNFYIEWNILENLKVTGRLGVSKHTDLREDFYPASHTRFIDYSEDRFFERGSYSKTDGEATSIRADINANYSFAKREHALFVNAGYSVQQDKSESVGFEVIGFPNDNMDFIAFAKQFPENSRPSGSESFSRELGILGALNYSYGNRFLADFSWRANASSMFGANKRWGQFWSAGIGWNIHNETFLKGSKALKQLKLRASTGYTGSQNFNSYQALATFSYYLDQAYDNWVGSYLMGLSNDDLKWQKTKDYNVGMDLNLFGRLVARFDYYVTDTEDQLLDLTIPPSMGFTSYRENLGSTQNKGIELKLNGHVLADVENDRYLSLFFTLAKNSNKIRKISNALQSYNDEQDKKLVEGSDEDDGWTRKPVTRFVEGQSVSVIWAVRSLGIDPATGKELFLNKDGEITSEWKAEDQVVCGDATPKCTGTFGLNMDYKGFSLNMSFYYRLGGQVYNQTLIDRVENADIRLNVDKRIYDAVWTQPNDRVAFTFNPFQIVYPTSRFVQDVRELQFSSFNLGYDFKNHPFVHKIGLERLKVNFYMNDVFRASTVKIERGLEYPFARTFSFSLQATF